MHCHLFGLVIWEQQTAAWTPYDRESSSDQSIVESVADPGGWQPSHADSGVVCPVLSLVPQARESQKQDVANALPRVSAGSLLDC